MTRPPLFISRSSRAELVRSPRRTRALLYLVALTAGAIGLTCGYRSGAEARPPALPGFRITLPEPRVHLDDPAPQAAPAPEAPAPRILFIRC